MTERSDADDKLRQGQTVKEALDRCIEIVEAHRTVAPRGEIDATYDHALESMRMARAQYLRARIMHTAPEDPDR